MFRDWPRSDPSVPLVAAIFPESTLAAPEPVEPVGHLDAHPFSPRTARSGGRRVRMRAAPNRINAADACPLAVAPFTACFPLVGFVAWSKCGFRRARFINYTNSSAR
jgi:hypothetical protein